VDFGSALCSSMMLWILSKLDLDFPYSALVLIPSGYSFFKIGKIVLNGILFHKAIKFYQILLPSLFHVGAGLNNPTDNYQQQGDKEGKL
jgi:hypothetical protein